jgi:hypothetical protein
MYKQTLVGRHAGKRSFCRPKHRWENSIKVEARAKAWIMINRFRVESFTLTALSATSSLSNHKCCPGIHQEGLRKITKHFS